MQKKIIYYMNKVKRPVDIYDIAKEVGENEVILLDELKEMKNKGMVKMMIIPLTSKIKSSTYYELTEANIEY